MISVTNECVDCGLPCLGVACPHNNVKRYYCDICGEEVEKLYRYEGDEVCADCILAGLEPVEV